MGDCYFITALLSLSQHRDELEKIFITKEPNEAGVYALNLIVNGEQKTIIIDDFIPVWENPYHIIPAFLRTALDVTD